MHPRAAGALRVAAAATDAAAGAALVAAGALLALTWVDTGDAPRGGMLGLVGAMWLVPTGALFLTAAAAVWRRWRWWPALQLLPLLYPLGFGALLEAIG